jgi:hypothetical protein
MMRMSALTVEERARFGDESRRIVADFGSERFADGLRRAAECAIALGPGKRSFFSSALLQSLLRR